MGLVTTFTVTTNFSAVTAQTVCKTIEVGEDDSVTGYPTVDLRFKKNSGDNPMQKTAGKTYLFQNSKEWQPGQIVGYVAAATGSTTVFQDET